MKPAEINRIIMTVIVTVVTTEIVHMYLSKTHPKDAHQIS